MNAEELKYLDLLTSLIESGEKRKSRSGDTRSTFSSSLRFSMEGWRIPLLTTKKMFLKGVVEELLFFIRGETNTKLLEEKGVNIWKGNTSREFLDKLGHEDYPEGEMGPMYGYQWRHFSSQFRMGGRHQGGFDQLSQALHLIKKDPSSRRIMVTAYDPSESIRSVLDPCHLFFQFYVSEGKLSCQFVMRSTDAFLGLPFNVASYAILTHLMARASGLEPGELVFVGGDTHLYENHIEAATEQTRREPYNFPTLSIEGKVDSIEDIEALTFNQFNLHDYSHHPPIKAPMAV